VQETLPLTSLIRFPPETSVPLELFAGLYQLDHRIDRSLFVWPLKKNSSYWALIFQSLRYPASRPLLPFSSSPFKNGYTLSQRVGIVRSSEHNNYQVINASLRSYIRVTNSLNSFFHLAIYPGFAIFRSLLGMTSLSRETNVSSFWSILEKATAKPPVTLALSCDKLKWIIRWKREKGWSCSHLDANLSMSTTS
jgi:hypothetical protein